MVWKMCTLKKIRQDRGLERIDVAEKLKSSIETVISIETARKKITLDEAAKLANVYKLSLDDIFEAVQETKKEKKKNVAVL